MKQKFAYIQHIASSNKSDQFEMCMAVFISFYTTPVWVPVRCNDSMANNYFLCETHSRQMISKHPYKHSAFTCPHGYTFADRACWGISNDTSKGNARVKTVAFLLMFLSAWSLGQVRRRVILLHTVGKQRTCLVNYDFDYQHYKEWRFESGCRDVYYSLLKRKPLIDQNTCQGNFVIHQYMREKETIIFPISMSSQLFCRKF